MNWTRLVSSYPKLCPELGTPGCTHGSGVCTDLHHLLSINQSRPLRDCSMGAKCKPHMAWKACRAEGMTKSHSLLHLWVTWLWSLCVRRVCLVAREWMALISNKGKCCATHFFKNIYLSRVSDPAGHLCPCASALIRSFIISMKQLIFVESCRTTFYISLLIIFCIIEYVTNKSTLNLDIFSWMCRGKHLMRNIRLTLLVPYACTPELMCVYVIKLAHL